MRNENNEIIRYKAQLAAQGFSRRFSIDYEETYSLVIDAITFRFLISLVVRLMDVITTYLYESINNDMYMKILEEYKFLEANNTKPRNMNHFPLSNKLGSASHGCYHNLSI